MDKGVVGRPKSEYILCISIIKQWPLLSGGSVVLQLEMRNWLFIMVGSSSTHLNLILHFNNSSSLNPNFLLNCTIAYITYFLYSLWSNQIARIYNNIPCLRCKWINGSSCIIYVPHLIHFYWLKARGFDLLYIPHLIIPFY